MAHPNPGTDPNAPLPSGVRCLPLVANAPLLPGMATNCYLVESGGGTLVVDPPSSAADALAAIVDSARLPITHLLVTHTHPDHIAGIVPLANATAATVVAHPLARPHLSSLLRVEPVEEGSSVAGWQVLHTPGHRPDSITFLEPVSGTAIVGDLVAGAGTVILNPPEGELAPYLASLRRLRALRPTMLLPGHGPLVTDPSTLLDHFIAHRLDREQKVLAVLSSTPHPLSRLLPLAYADTPRALYPLAERSLLAHLLKLQAEGRATEHAGGWQRSASHSP